MGYPIPTLNKAEAEFSKSVDSYSSDWLYEIKEKIVEAFICGHNLVEISCSGRDRRFIKELWSVHIYQAFLKADLLWGQVLTVEISDEKIICYFDKFKNK